MMLKIVLRWCAVVAAGLLLGATAVAVPRDPLPSWQAGAARTAITRFVRDVTTTGSERYVPPAERLAVFDNDGMLWSEQPT